MYTHTHIHTHSETQRKKDHPLLKPQKQERESCRGSSSYTHTHTHREVCVYSHTPGTVRMEEHLQRTPPGVENISRATGVIQRCSAAPVWNPRGRTQRSKVKSDLGPWKVIP